MSPKISPIKKIPPIERSGEWKELIGEFADSKHKFVRVNKPEVEPLKLRSCLDMAIRNLGLSDKLKVSKRGKDVYLAKKQYLEVQE